MKQKKFISLILALCMILGMATTAMADGSYRGNMDYSARLNTILENIANTYKSTTGDWFDFPEWYVMDMGAYEFYAPDSENKLPDDIKQNYVNYAVKDIAEAESDSAVYKAVLGLVAIGKDPNCLYTASSNTAISAIEKLNGLTKSTSVWCAPYTLAVYNQGDYETEAYETELVDALLANQLENGCWNEYDTVIDTTANAIWCLSFYKDNSQVKRAIDNALEYLSKQQNDSGAYGGNANSTAMVAIGLCAAGVDLENDTRFIKNGNNIIDGLLSFALADNSGFGYKDNQNKDNYATEQGFRALIAVMQRLKSDDAYNIYDFSENELTSAKSTENQGETGNALTYEEKIEVLAKRGVLSGRDDGFALTATLTRAEFTAFIVKCVGFEFTGENVFTDVKSDSWYKNYVNTAYSCGVIKGVSDTEFNPEGKITKEEASVMVQRTAKLCKIEKTYDENNVRDILAGFTDYVKVSSWAKEGLAFCYDNGILSNSDLEISPKNAVTREEIVSMLYNMMFLAKLL